MSKYGFRAYLAIIEDRIRCYKHECAFVFDIEGNIISKHLGTTHSVRFGKEEKKLFKDCIATHNHPICATFSSNDIEFFNKHSLREMRVVHEAGSSSICSQSNNKLDSLRILVAYHNLQDNPDVLEFEEKMRDKDNNKYGAKYYHYQAIVCKLADELDLIYTEEVLT